MVRERPGAGGANASAPGASSPVVIMGDVRLLASIPFNYRDQLHPDLFERMQQMETSDTPGLQDDLIVPKCSGGSGRRRPSSSLNSKCYEYGDGDELITPVYIGPKDVSGGGPTTTTSSSPIAWSVPCGDDEDCPYWEGVEGSGRRNDKDDLSVGRKYSTLPTPATTTRRYREVASTVPQNPEYDQIYLPDDFGYPDGPPPTPGPPPSLNPMPPAGGSGRSYENYDPKYNIYENPEEGGSEAAAEGGDDGSGGVSSGSPTGRVKYARPNVSGTLLVIGIICVVIIAIILIIVIVLKMRTTEEASLKVTESKSFQAESEVVAGLAAAAGGAAAGSRHAAAATTNGLKAVRTTNNNNKPVKEWYV